MNDELRAYGSGRGLILLLCRPFPTDGDRSNEIPQSALPVPRQGLELDTSPTKVQVTAPLARPVRPYNEAGQSVTKMFNPLERRVKCHLPSAGINRSSPYSPR